MSENQTVEDYPCRRCQVFIGEIVASLNIDDSFQCKRTFAHGVLGGGNQPKAAQLPTAFGVRQQEKRLN